MSLEEDIQQVVTGIWDAMLRLPVEASRTSSSSSGGRMSACIHIAGTWKGTVALDFDGGCGAQIAGAMLGLDPDKAQPADIRDALGEITNMVGGNIKALLPGDNHLSLPTVVDGSDHAVHVPGNRLISRVPLISAGHQFTVSLLRNEKLAA